MNIKKGALLELAIENMAFGGHGVARVEGFVLFVRGGVRGDRLLARVIRKKKDYAEARVVELIEPSPDRIAAPCPYHGHCGGCQWQHVQYGRQLDFKRQQVMEAVARIGGLPHVPVHATIPSENIYSYRNKMEFSFSDRRWLLPHEMGVEGLETDFALGLHAPGTFYKVIDIEACLLQHDTGNRILRKVREIVRETGLPPYGIRSHQGFWRYLTLRYSSAFDEWMVNVVTSSENLPVLNHIADVLGRSFPAVRTVVNNINSRKAGIAVGEKELCISGPGFIRDRIGPYTFQVSANSFFQTNTSGADRLYRKVAEYAELTGSEKVLDLYSGTGTIPIYLSKEAESVVGMEIAESAVMDAVKNCRDNDVHCCRFILGDIKENLKNLDWSPDVLIIDPPRAGMHKKVAARVMELGAERVVYVSCNPGTMARDLSLLADRYEVLEIQPVDMFPHTYHVESVAKLVVRKS
ncbi:MAG: 23S rRNA (uracil(1939)-C(5))-methyltransferase RlmD [Deltaproteobacteria bacterium]|nr:23S rRNA (uracil(1939)-C(5))-methyltransferase RlmD [Deltaproteobacteria bacterium]MBW2017174.1 23S rRNA (uracil(1939)-C(5))-methyltransferase RlmD [Deltaproteobacteria bacterium]MBW2129981.1 23S rRNA (uracil(1939)-C(5))-methyltransferase RlmD [Deltaproteobacteria bacterium]MBW2302208.1 23S rRNA (uracil(1939)-C(5))-methyltransferase RlmD [Deltaproteobacteria bacterium]